MQRLFPQVLLDSELQEELQYTGAVRLPMLNEEEINAALAIFNDTHPAPEQFLSQGFYSSIYLGGFETKQGINNALAAIVNPHLSDYFTNHYALLYAFVVKPNGRGSQLEFHQDKTWLDETRNQTFTLWIPLHHSNEENGTVYTLRGSHLLSRQPRAETLPGVYKSIEHLLPSLMEPYECAAGEGLVIDQALLHYSPRNRTQRYRVAITAVIAPKEVPIVVYHAPNYPDISTVNIYEPPVDVLLHYSDFRQQFLQPPPDSRLLKKIEGFKIKPVTENELNEFLKRRS